MLVRIDDNLVLALINLIMRRYKVTDTQAWLAFAHLLLMGTLSKNTPLNLKVEICHQQKNGEGESFPVFFTKRELLQLVRKVTENDNKNENSNDYHNYDNYQNNINQDKESLKTLKKIGGFLATLISLTAERTQCCFGDLAIKLAPFARNKYPNEPELTFKEKCWANAANQGNPDCKEHCFRVYELLPIYAVYVARKAEEKKAKEKEKEREREREREKEKKAKEKARKAERTKSEDHL